MTRCGDVVGIERLEGRWRGDVVGLERLGSRSRHCTTQHARAEPKFQALDSQDKSIQDRTQVLRLVIHCETEPKFQISLSHIP